MRRFAEHLTDGSCGRGRDRYRSCIVLLVIAAVAGVASLAQAAAAESARGLGVKVQASNPLAPTVTLTNNTAGPCQVVTAALGALVLTGVRQGGKEIAPVPLSVSFDDASEPFRDERDRADTGVEAVGADDQIGGGVGGRRRTQPDTAGGFVEVSQTVIEPLGIGSCQEEHGLSRRSRVRRFRRD